MLQNLKLLQEKPKASHDEPESHEGQTGANPRQERSLRCESVANLGLVPRFRWRIHLVFLTQLCRRRARWRGKRAPLTVRALSRRRGRALEHCIDGCLGALPPSAPETPMAPTIWPSTITGSAPGCGKSRMKVGARFSPLRTILLVSEVGRRQRRADFAFNSAVSMALSVRLPWRGTR